MNSHSPGNNPSLTSAGTAARDPFKEEQPMRHPIPLARTAAAGLACAALAFATACSSGGGDQDADTYTCWG
jgi:hypothetical protein